ncbi:Uncharacterised protein [Vibrio cholerae]|nr:Uncharacterised protein [Vibrio cholerae]CSC55822.1 Uncharacterised protein [Vibrio cholerae]
MQSRAARFCFSSVVHTVLHQMHSPKLKQHKTLLPQSAPRFSRHGTPPIGAHQQRNIRLHRQPNDQSCH